MMTCVDCPERQIAKHDPPGLNPPNHLIRLPGVRGKPVVAVTPELFEM